MFRILNIAMIINLINKLSIFEDFLFKKLNVTLIWRLQSPYLIWHFYHSGDNFRRWQVMWQLANFL